MAAAAKYASDDSGGEADRPMKVCAEAGRKCVRNIHQYPILSPEWIQLVDSLKQLTRLVQLEGRMPANSKVSEAHGRNADSEGTLWDQEAHENAIRILVEEAKVNLCLRMMHDFKKWQYNPEEKKQTIRDRIQQADYSEAQLEQKCRQFEESLGQLLWRSFVHVETLQLMDIPLLIEHCALVLDHCEKFRKERLECSAKEQELLAMYYVSSLFKHAEALNNGELLAKAREYRLLHMALSHVLAHVREEYPEEISWDIALGLAALSDNEDFSTEWQSFFADECGQLDRNQMITFMQLKDVLVDPLLAKEPDRKKDIRPLLDFFNTLTRKLG